MRIIVSEFMEEAILRAGLPGWDILYAPALVDDRAALLTALADAEALIVRNRTQVNAELLAAAPKLRAVGRLGVGLDNIDMAACKARDVAVFPAFGANDIAVAEYVIGAALSLLRGVFTTPSLVAQGAWPRSAMMAGREITAKRLGLVGFGAIARETAKRAMAMGMEVAAFDPFVAQESPVWDMPAGRVRAASLAEVIAGADVLSLHVPLTPETRHMIDASALRSMKPSAIVINAARGGVIDERALAEALRRARLGGAALDVFEEEPPSADTIAAFADLPNVILTPHIAGLSHEANVRVSEMTVRALYAHLTREVV